MRVLLTSSASHDPARGGSTRSNLRWLELLAASGHVCHVVCPAAEGHKESQTAKNRVEILSIPHLARRRDRLSREIQAFTPDFVLVSSEDLSHMLLREAHTAVPDRLVYLAHTPQFFPFGPESWNPDTEATAIVRAARRVVVIGEHMRGYVHQHLGREAVVVHPPIYGAPPFARFGHFDHGSILMINPCAVKGIEIFLGLARAFPQLRFAALKGWGTTPVDLAALASLPNVTTLESVGNIEETLSSARVLLMPSIWYEGFGLIAMEAMLRGLPVIASDSGGLAEAKRGTGFVIPVRPVERYEPVFDENHMPRPVSAPQDLEPWKQALAKLLSDREVYQAESDASREAALRFVSGLRPSQFEETLLNLGQHRRLKILLAHNSLYYPSHGGGDKSNRLLMEALAARGHEVRVVARIERFGVEPHARHVSRLAARAAAFQVDGPAVTQRLNGVDVRTLTLDSHWRAFFSDQVREFDPDVILTSSDDPAQLLLDIALRAPRARVVYLARATIAAPFGPDSSSASVERTAALRRCDGAVGVSEYVARYLRAGGVDAVHLPISLMEPGPYADLAHFENPYVTLVNPCAVKGISIFLALADSMPAVSFAAVPTWGTNAADLDALRKRPNITILDPAENIEDIFRRTKVLLVPSLWAEARSRIVVEAMARGVPVIASDVGGIPEAKLGIPYLIRVRRIERYKPAVDENMAPVAEVLEQDIEPWRATLARLLRDREHYEELSRASRIAAREYARNVSVAPFEEYLERIVRTPKRSAPEVKLSEEKQKLLALRLKQRAWFPYAEPRAEKPRLFCFPYAGGGALAYKSWITALDSVAAVSPVRLPGRETRGQEQPFARMAGLVEALESVIAPYLSQPFAFYGHSMGAAIAFELTRALRRHGRPLPRGLFVSGARAPQFRLNWSPPPEPCEDQLLEQLRSLNGVPAEVLEDLDLMRLAWPAIRADTALYRNYVYAMEPPLPVPIFAYAGSSDPNVGVEQAKAWSEQSSVRFTSRRFQGGHFFIQSERESFLKALLDDLRSLS